MTIFVFAILLAVLFLPFFVRSVGDHLEAFIFLAGLLTALFSGVMDADLLQRAIRDPVPITLAVLIAGLLFKWLQRPLERGVVCAAQGLSLPLFAALTVFLLGLASSLITAVVSALVLVTIADILPLAREAKLRFVVIACFSIGLGAVLTPLGEPLATIATKQLNQDFWYLFRSLGPFILPILLALGAIAYFSIRSTAASSFRHSGHPTESYSGIFLRGGSIYLFVVGLTLLGAGLAPYLVMWTSSLDAEWLYWLNMISAAVDNATLTAAEVHPELEPKQIQMILLGLLVSGGMLIPGNIPNIVAANKLSISSWEWARIGLPLGLSLMGLLFLFLTLR